jgi:hypothetical protein
VLLHTGLLSLKNGMVSFLQLLMAPDSRLSVEIYQVTGENKTDQKRSPRGEFQVICG